MAARRQHDDVVLFQHDKCRPAKPADPFSAHLVDKPDGSVVVELVGMGNNTRLDAAQERERIVLARLDDGPARSAEIAAVADCNQRTIQRTLADLVRKSIARRDDAGLYWRVNEECG